MNIGFDLRPSLLKPTGVGSYVLALAARLPGAAPDHHFYFFSASLRDRYPSRAWPANVTLVDRCSFGKCHALHESTDTRPHVD